jgi:uncharacterized membrane protein (UPF0127 family)
LCSVYGLPEKKKNMSEKVKLKKWHFYFLCIAIAIFVLLKLFDWLYWPHAVILVAGRSVDATIASTPSHWLKGLSGKSGLRENEGMWFKFNTRDYHTMVMRDMKFPIDIVWLDSDKVVDIAPGLKPENGLQESQLTLYRPRLPATAVLELPSGFAASSGLKIGDTVAF